MALLEILAEIDLEIAQLQRARALLTGKSELSSAKSTNDTPKKSRKRKRKLTPEGRKRIAEAVKRRWARQKKAAAQK